MKRYVPPIVYVPMTDSGYAKLVKEKEQLTFERIDALAHLVKSRALGDLKENGYYQASRQKMNFIDGRLRKIGHMLKYSVIVEKTSDSSIDIGNTVTLDLNGKEYKYKVVGEEEANPSEGKVSYVSPIGHGLLNKTIGDIVEVKTPMGINIYKIKKIN